MKRRAFMGVFIVGLGMSLLSLIGWFFKPAKNTALAQPKFLSLLCDNETLQMLGRAYLKLKPDETNNKVLWNDLLKEQLTGKLLGAKEISTLELQIEEKIRQDFKSENIVVVQGWVLSVTEARQCAIFSIINA